LTRSITAPLLTESSPPAALGSSRPGSPARRCRRPEAAADGEPEEIRPEREDTALIAEQGVHEREARAAARLSRLAAVRVLGSRESSEAAPGAREVAPPETSITFWPDAQQAVVSR